ncbi:heme-binding protein, partial [Klebsiella pneumoniae]
MSSSRPTSVARPISTGPDGPRYATGSSCSTRPCPEESETMHSKPVLGREEVARVLGAAREEAQRQGWAVSIAVVDDAGHPLALGRLDRWRP